MHRLSLLYFCLFSLQCSSEQNSSSRTPKGRQEDRKVTSQAPKQSSQGGSDETVAGSSQAGGSDGRAVIFEDVKSLFLSSSKGNCAKSGCHDKATTSNKVNLYDYESIKLNAARAISAVQAGRMPPASVGKRLSSAEINLLKSWMNSGFLLEPLASPETETDTDTDAAGAAGSSLGKKPREDEQPAQQEATNANDVTSDKHETLETLQDPEKVDTEDASSTNSQLNDQEDTSDETSDDELAISYTQHIAPLLALTKGNCTSCHSQKGGQLPKLDSYDAVKSKADRVLVRTKAASMPPPSAINQTATRALTSSEVQLLEAWITTGKAP